ncbi:GDP-mannose 4,6-dehydratase [Falsiruegeria litorea R37]|uniref:GDP-mannose 4,6-dehydratase n=1 Tax=Falsiruegeria litorea R37 TaxID=1200284 RepID=A0A1Y5TVQ3_9RHOB|nr:GDP-mannose 4,6-dehydratase [Falsiruegeria litorea]SLN74451.1 GDP-mannose 4,6-dehydratase [Falsiruegeria litorea R37]
MSKTALILGISGQDGAYLAQLLLEKGYIVVGTSRDATIQRFGNLERLGIADRIVTHSMVLTDFRSVVQTLSAVNPDEIYNLSGQSSVGLSFQQPLETLESIAVGVINLMEAIRFLQLPVRFYNAGSSECFGETSRDGAREDTSFKPRSPYATAKATAFWGVANYREAYGLQACTGILFNHESPLRPNRFVTQKIVAGAVAIARAGGGELHLGTLTVSRDWGWAPEYVDAMWRMLQQETLQDYVIATGESYTLQAFCDAAFAAVGLRSEDHVRTSQKFERPSDIAYSLGNPRLAAERLDWRPSMRMPQVVEAMVRAEWDAT